MGQKLQLNHSLTGFNAVGEDLGLKVSAKLYSITSDFEPLTLKASNVVIAIRPSGENGYINLSIPTSVESSEEITDRIEGNIEVKVLNIIAGGAEYIAQIFDEKIDDFRFDLGSRSSTFSFVLRADFSTPVKKDITLTSYISKRKLSYDGAISRYIYSVNPVDFRYFSVGATLTEGDLVGLISEISLQLNNSSIELLVEISV